MKSETFVGMTFGLFPPFAHRGVPEIVRMTSWSVVLRSSDGLVDVVEDVRRIERIRRVRRAGLGHEVPLDEQAHDRRVRLSRGLDPRGAIADPAEARVVVEADPHPLGRERRRRRECRKGEQS